MDFANLRGFWSAAGPTGSASESPGICPDLFFCVFLARGGDFADAARAQIQRHSWTWKGQRLQSAQMRPKLNASFGHLGFILGRGDDQMFVRALVEPTVNCVCSLFDTYIFCWWPALAPALAICVREVRKYKEGRVIFFHIWFSFAKGRGGND